MFNNSGDNEKNKFRFNNYDFVFWIGGAAQVIKGNGKLISDTRDLSGYTGIIAQGKFNLILTQGEKEGIRIETDENVVELFQTRIDEKILYITMVADVKISEALNVYVSVKELEKIILLSEVALKTESVIHFDQFSIISGGMCQVDMELFAADLNVKLTDGTYGVFKGYAENFTAEVHDETELNAFDLQTDNADISASGLTEVMVDVQKDMKLMITGASNLYYTGNPVVSQRIFSSTGFIVKRQRKN